MQLQSNKSIGYTLIEILIGLSIIGILFAVGYANFRDYARRQAVVAASRSLRGDLRLAQEQALAGQKPTGCGTLNGYQVNVSSNSYEIDAVCDVNNVISIKTVVAAPGITFTVPTPNPVLFKVLATGTNIPSGAKAIIGLTQVTTNNYRSVIVSYSGDVKESTETPTPTATPSPTPTLSPTPPPFTWRYIGTWNFSCGNVVSIAGINASQIAFAMASGGGPDGVISYNCYGSTGMQANFGGGAWVTAPGPCGWTANNTTVASAGQTTVTALRGLIGCNDGESANVNVYSYGP